MNKRHLIYPMTATVLIGIVVTVFLWARPTSSAGYEFGFINKTGHDLQDVYAYKQGREIAGPGLLVMGGNATEGSLDSPIPPEIELKWDQDQVHHNVKAKLEGVVPRNFTGGTIYFVFEKNGSVIVKAVKSDDTGAVIKGVRP